MDCSRGFATPSGAIKRVISPTFFNLVLILSSPRADIDRHLFVILWAFLLTVTGEQTERAVGKELGQLVGTKPITVSHQHTQIKGQYWPPCPFGGYVGARIKHFSSLRIVDHPSQVSWLMGVWLVAPGPMRTVISRRVKRAPIVRVSVSKDLMGEVLPPILLAPFPVLLGWLAARDCSEPRA